MRLTCQLLLFGWLFSRGQTAIILDFNSNGDEAITKVFQVRDVSEQSLAVADIGSTKPSFTVSNNSQALSGVVGSLKVTWIGKDKGAPGENATNWSFGPNTTIHSNLAGLGVMSLGESGGQSQFSDGEAMTLTFDLSSLDFTPGVALVFSVQSYDDESFRIFQRTGLNQGSEVYAMSALTPSVFSDKIPVATGFSPTKGIYEFAIADAGWDGGNLLRVKSFSVDVVRGPPPTAAPTVNQFVVSADSEIVIDFNVAGDDAGRKTFEFTDVGSASPVVRDLGSSRAAFTVSPSSEKLTGAFGTLRVTWAGKDKSSTAVNASTWTFGPDAIVESSSTGLGVQSLGDSGGNLRFGDGEAFVLSFDTSSLSLYPGSRLVFTLLSDATETYRVFQRTGLNSGKKVFEMGSFIQSIPSDPILVSSGYQSSAGVYDFAIVDAGWDGGSLLRMTRFSVGIVGAPAQSNYVPPRFFPMFTDNMVLQRNASVNVYGTALPGMAITVSFGTIQSKTTTTDSNGNWRITLNGLNPSFVPQRVAVSDGIQSATIANVLVGDVWLASGQSNMDRPFWTYKSLNTTGKDNPFIRLVQVQRGGPKTPSDSITLTPELDGSWQECTSHYLTEFSPGAYFFGAKMENITNVPIGLMHVAVGATVIEEWMSAEALQMIGVDPNSDDSFTRNYNGMIHPLKDFAFKGILWYQGESNSKWPTKYQQSFPVMIQSWRTLFGRGDIPFYFAQLASHGDNDWDVTNTAKAFLRDAQKTALALPNTRMIVLTDVGEYLNLHPQNKMAVGERFARHALTADGYAGYNTDSPTYRSMQISGNRVTITFDKVSGGLETRMVKMNYNEDMAQGTDPQAFVVPANELWGFAVSGPNQVFVEANATITATNQVTVWSQYVQNPVAVRYCFKWFGLCNLFASNDGWPTTPFRTDNFTMPDFSGYSFGNLFDGNFSALGSPMNISTNVGPSRIYPITVDSISGYQAVPYTSTTRQIYYSTSNPAFQNNPKPYVVVKILYYDRGVTTDNIRFRYTHLNGTSDYAPITIMINNTKTWRVASSVLYDALFNKSLLNNDLRLQSDTNDMIIGGVYLSGAPTS